MPLSIPIYMALHYSLCSWHHNYNFNSQPLSSGVLRDSSFSCYALVQNTALKASRLVRMIMTAFKSRNLEFLENVFVTYIRPVLEYALSIWSPSSDAYCIMHENVQHKCTPHLQGMAELNHEQRLSMLNLSKLYDRCVYNVVLLVYKVLYHKSNFTASDIITTLRHAPTRSNGEPSTTLQANFYST